VGRKIILLSDGTGNSSAKVWRTNVWRVFESLDLSGSDQIAFYDDGVGTAAFKPLAILGGAFGFGLGRNVVDIYKFACRNYRADDDEIYGFGFSRGAFTMRVVTGLILEQGLVEADSEPELHSKAKAAYRAYRANNFHTKWPRYVRPENWVRCIRDIVAGSYSNPKEVLRNYRRISWPRSHHPMDWLRWFRKIFTEKPATRKRTTVNIRFLGLWDTVAAYGMPVEEMARGISQWIWPWMLPNCVLDPSVQRACQALSIDDDRTTFHPTLWDETNEKPLVPDAAGERCLANERISQVWFAGVHSNVGGGYPDDSLAQIPLIWIMSEAHACGLHFKAQSDANPQTYGHPATAQDKDGRIYDPRAGLGGYYRYGPRDIRALTEGLLSRQGVNSFARVHESVFARIKNRAYAYAPLGLPADYEVVTVNNQVVTPQQSGYESPAQANARWRGQQKVWNIVWWRRILYFLTVIVSLALFGFPLAALIPTQDEYTTHLRWVSEIVRTAGKFLPQAATPWLDGYAGKPVEFLIILALLGITMLGSSLLAGKIQGKMGQLWRASLDSKLTDPGLPTDLIYRLRNSPRFVRFHRSLNTKITPALFALLFLYLGATFTSHALFNVQDYAGWVCNETKGKLQTLNTGDFLVLYNGKFDTLDADTFNKYAERAKSDQQIKKEDKSNPFKYLPQYLADTHRALPELQTSELCQSMGVTLDQYQVINIKFDKTDSFISWNGANGAYGYYSLDLIRSPHDAEKTAAFVDTAKSLATMVGVTALVPLRRELTMPWFRIVARIGGVGGQEETYEPDFSDMFTFDTDIKTKRQGELFLFVNDAVIGWPPLYDAFYKHNAGKVQVLITGK
jgi:uncharacterized protein (DUF2235 family)